jgi:glycosyltransferase involved in cell wall biosynthesis|tara:strand:- start:1546 stop:2517 length:972 start_codon:yes stop_codon:yes gene_type:complete
MKVVHLVLSNAFAGIEQHVDELLSNKLNDKPILICNDSIADCFDKSISIYKIKNIGRRSLYGKYKLKKLLSKINPDIVHTHGSKTSSIISSINNNRFKHVATVHGIKKNKKVYEKADFIIGVSQKTINGLKNNVAVVTNWWNPSLNKIDHKKNEYALAIGRLEKVKGFDLLINSWANINTKLVIIGSGKEKNTLTNMINAKGLNEKVTIIDNVQKNELINYYRNAKLLIISSRDEGGPRVALEALYLEIPVLSTDVGHMSKLLPKEMLANTNDLISLQTLLERYVDKIDTINQGAVFEFITNEFSIDEKISEIKDIYESLLIS